MRETVSMRTIVNTDMKLMSVLLLTFYGCETWFLTLREEHRLRVFENRVLRRIFGPKRGEETGGWMDMALDRDQ
jgi:hypothetical protein